MIQALGSVALPVPLACGDCAFFGVGADNRPLRIAVERKKIGDLASCILDGRYIYQAQRAKSAGFDILALIVEGRVHCNSDDGLLEIPVWGISPRTLRRCQIYEPVKLAITYSRWCQYLFEIYYLLGIPVFRTESVQETACVIKGLWSWFQRPDHQSMKVVYKQPSPTMLLTKPRLVRRMAVELKGVGWERSIEVSKRFSTVAEMLRAVEEDWSTIPGIGKKLAKSIVTELHT